MEYEYFLDRAEVEIIKIVEKAGYKIEENTTPCLLSNDYVGFLNKKRKVIIICTKNAKRRENYTYKGIRNNDSFERTGLHIKKALRHEAIHVAQECNDGKILKLKKEFSMNPTKIRALNKSIKISGDEEKERQAYILESKPKIVEKELRKYCL
tara:strand:+ start:142 stop:600 length:459 start_codon:yes stop_codon:yes gene_type:complete